MLHHKQKLSIVYWLYSIATALSVSKLGSWFFARTKENMIGKYSTKWQKMWWRMYLVNFLYYCDEETLTRNDGEPINVVWLQEYHFEYWNAFFEMSALSHTLFEIANGRTPCIKDKFGIWNMFFMQPVAGPFESKDVPENEVKGMFFTSKFTPYNKTATKLWCKLFRAYVKFNSAVSEYVEEEQKHILTAPEKTLGVICRGTDYIILRPKNHPKQPEVNEVIECAKSWIKKYGYSKIYLATEEEAIFNRFESEFPGMILTNKRTYYDKQMVEKNLTEITAVHFDRDNDNYLKGLEYLSSLCILSKCDALLGGNCGGSTIATFLNDGKYSRTKIYDKGIY